MNLLEMFKNLTEEEKKEFIGLIIEEIDKEFIESLIKKIKKLLNEIEIKFSDISRETKFIFDNKGLTIKKDEN